MFSAKKNIASAASSASKNQKKSPFIKPEMKVVKSDVKKQDVAKEQAKEMSKETALTVAKESGDTFFGAKKEQIGNKGNTVAGEITKEVDKEGANAPKEGAGKKSKLKEGTKGVLKSIDITGGVSATKTASQGANVATQTVKSKAEGAVTKAEGGKKEKEAKEEGAVAEGKIPKAPTKPEDDPAFQTQIKATEKAKEEKSQHPEASAKVGEQVAAGQASPEAQAGKNDQQAHAASMSATSEKEREPFTPESFKKLLEKNLDDLEKELPKNSDEADEFKDEKPIEKIKKNISGEVTSESDKLAGPMKNEADKPAPVTGAPTIEAQPLPVADAGAPPKPLNAKAAIPKPKTSQEISMEKESQSLDNKMSENEITEEQLAKSNEPKFTGALEQKNQAQTEARLAPVNYRKKEGAQLGAAQTNAATSSQEGLNQMQGAKQLSENTVLENQTTNKTTDKTEKEKIFAEFEAIYEETKKTVTDSLEKLSEDVDKKFSEEAESAQKTFEENVEDGLGDIYGFTVVDDWLFGEDTEAIDKLFRVEKNTFVTKMNSVLDDISIIIADGLNAALDAIAEGKKKSKEKFDGLDESQKKLGEEAFNDFNDQYADLEDTVYEKQEELAADLAQSYKENVDSLKEKFDEIKETVSAGWIGAALNALVGVIKMILKIKDLLLDLLAAAVSAIGAIISDPIGFLSNLIQGVKQGFVDFGNNIKKHMIKGVIEWLTGSLGDVGITMPDNLFSLSGIFSLVTQMLGLTWDYFRGKAVKLLGEPLVAGMEKAVEIFQIVKKDGVMGLWEYIKEQFGNLKEMVMDAIRDMVITKVIEAGIKWVMGLLSPAGAFVKAAMMIIDIVKFFVERAAQIFELVTAFVDSIKALAAGNVKAVAAGIEKALAKAIPVLISFLAALVGITGLTGKIQKIIKKVRKKIDKAINKILKKAKKAFRKLVKKGKAKVKKGIKGLLQWWKKKKKFKAKDGKSHTLYYKGKGKSAKMMVASAPTAVEVMLNHKLKVAEDLKKVDIKKAISLYKETETLKKDIEKATEANQKSLDTKLTSKMSVLSSLMAGIMVEGDKAVKEFLKKHLNKNVYIKSGKSLNKTFEKEAKKIGYEFFSVDDPNLPKQIKRAGGKAKSNPALTIESSSKILKEGSGTSSKPEHDNFIPQKIVIESDTKGKYKASYKTKTADGKAGPEFTVEISYDQAAAGITDKVQVRKVQGKNLSSKPSGLGRGKTDSASVFHNAHIIGDQFGGSGKNSSLNIHPSSPAYNTKDMLNVENQMAAHFKKSNQKYDLTATAKITDDKNSPGDLKELLAKEFDKDTSKIEYVKDEDDKQAKDKLIGSLQKSINRDMTKVPAKFLSINYNSTGLDNDFKKKMEKELENDERTEKPTTEILAVDKSINIGEDTGFEATKKKYLASKK